MGAGWDAGSRPGTGEPNGNPTVSMVMDSLPLCPQDRDQPPSGGTAYFPRLIAAPALLHCMGTSPPPPPHTHTGGLRPASCSVTTLFPPLFCLSRLGAISFRGLSDCSTLQGPGLPHV